MDQGDQVRGHQAAVIWSTFRRSITFRSASPSRQAADAARPRRRGNRITMLFAAVHKEANGTERRICILIAERRFLGEAEMHGRGRRPPSVLDDPEPTSVLQGTNWPVAKSWAYPTDWSRLG